MDAASLVLGIAIGLVAGLGLARLRQTPTVGQGSPGTGSPAVPVEPAERASHKLGTTTTVKRQGRVRVGPDGIHIEADGRTYRSIDEIPDAVLRDQMRDVLADLPGTVIDGPVHERVLSELRDAGIDAPDDPTDEPHWPDAASEASPGASPTAPREDAPGDTPPPVPPA
jgi:hypothetical protein